MESREEILLFILIMKMYLEQDLKECWLEKKQQSKFKK